MACILLESTTPQPSQLRQKSVTDRKQSLHIRLFQEEQSNHDLKIGSVVHETLHFMHEED